MTAPSTTTSSSTTATSRTVTGALTWQAVTALAAPLLLAGAGVASPINDSDEAEERLGDLLANSGRYNVALLLLAASLMLLVPAVLALRELVPSAGRRMATIGATGAAAGFMMFLTITGALGFGPSAWATLHRRDANGLLTAFTAMDDGEGALALVMPGPLLPVIGLSVLAAALWRHSRVPRPALVAMPLGWAIFLFSPIAPGKVAGALLLFTAFLAVHLSAARRPSAPTSAHRAAPHERPSTTPPHSPAAPGNPTSNAT